MTDAVEIWTVHEMIQSHEQYRERRDWINRKYMSVWCVPASGFGGLITWEFFSAKDAILYKLTWVGM